MVKVTVILPTYNSESVLQRTLDSIYQQSGNGKDFTIELIVVDDCSTDRTQGILLQNHIDFLTTSGNSGGPNQGRNIGMAMATGEYICFIDHDDVWARNKLTYQLKVAQICPIVTTGYSIVNTSDNKIFRFYEDKNEVTISSRNTAFIEKLTRHKKIRQPNPSTLMIHRSLRYIRFEEQFGMVDYDWQLRLFEHRPMAEIHKPLVTRYLAKNNLSLNRTYRRNDYEYSLKCLDFYKDQYPNEVALARKRINGTIARYYYVVGDMHAARQYFFRSIWDLKTMLYYATSYFGDSLVKKHFKVFG